MHKLIYLDTLFNVYRDLQTVDVCFISYARDLSYLVCLDKQTYLVNYRLDIGGVGYLCYLDTSLRLVKIVLCTQSYRASACAVYLVKLLLVVQHICAAGEIGTFKRFKCVEVGIFHKCDGRFAHLAEIERTHLARHRNGNTCVCVDKYGREGRREKRGLGSGVIIVWHKVNGVLVDVLEKLVADRLKLCLGITRCGISHIL